MKNLDPDDLSAKLRTWKIEPRASGSFQREVWQRIAARQTVQGEAFWPQFVQWISGVVASPRYAVAFVAISLFASIGVAHVRARDMNAQLGKQLEARYAASVDPLAMMSR